MKINLFTKKKFILALFCILCLSCLNFIGLAEEAEPEFDFEGLFDETLKTVEKENVSSGVFWIPQEFWKEIYSEKQGMSAANSELMKTVFEPYLIFIVSSSVKNGSRFKTLREKEIMERIKLVDRRGISYQPLDKNEINSTALSIVNRMKSAFSKRMAKKGAVPIFFAAKDSKGTQIINSQKEGSFKIILDSEEFKWKLPISALAKPFKCPKCGKTLNGTYRFCPYDATKLNH